jgi:predicted ATPase
MSSSENEVPTGSGARHSSQGQSRFQQEATTKQRDSNRENSRRRQIIYVNGRESVIRSPNGRLYTEEELYLHEQFWTVRALAPVTIVVE